jgi:hydrogenase nickel incorporation protein HypA/HybF
MSTAENILNAVLVEVEKHREKRIEHIEVSLDEHGFMEADEIKFCFDLLAEGTVAEGANLEIELADTSEAPRITLELD